jgi:Fe-S cluster assembly protein SufD
MNGHLAPSPAITERFSAARHRLPGANLPWMDALRGAAAERFQQSGFPTPKLEAWKFTSLDPLARLAFDAVDRPVPDQAFDRSTLTAYRLTPQCNLVVIVDGRFRPDLSDLDHLPGGTRITDLAAATEDDLRALAAPPAVLAEPRARSLSDLNTALMDAGAVVHLGRGATLDPVQILFIVTEFAAARAFHIRNLIRADAGASATVLETYVGLGTAPYWTNVVTQVIVEAGAVLRHDKLQVESRNAFHIAETSVRIGRDAAYRSFAAALGGALARSDVNVDLGATGAEVQLSGVTLARGNQHIDTTIRLSHSQPRGTSHQEFRSVVDDHAHSVFQGCVRVAPGAQKTDAQQLNHNLLLSASAAADSKPELEILADDVKCSHGSATGDLDKDALFYLRARGVGESAARALLINAFVGHLIDGIEGDAARAYFRRTVDGWLAGIGQ